MQQEVVEIPRSFKLLAEYDAATGKGGLTYISKEHEAFINYGWTESDDDNERIDMCYWNGIMIGKQGSQIGEVFYEFKIFVPKNYPQVPPVLTFVKPKVVMGCVDARGKVDPNRIVPGFQWKSTMNIADLLMAVRNNLCLDQVCRESAKVANQTY